MNNFIDTYMRQNASVYYDYESIVSPIGSSNMLTLNMQVMIPTKQKIQYIPGFYETIKFAWVQYMALLIPLYAILEFWILGFLFKE